MRDLSFIILVPLLWGSAAAAETEASVYFESHPDERRAYVLLRQTSAETEELFSQVVWESEERLLTDARYSALQDIAAEMRDPQNLRRFIALHQASDSEIVSELKTAARSDGEIWAYVGASDSTNGYLVFRANQLILKTRAVVIPAQRTANAQVKRALSPTTTSKRPTVQP